MPEFEHQGVHVEETGGKPKPIEGVPTGTGKALTAADRRPWLYGIAIGGFVLAGLGIWQAANLQDLIGGLFGTRAGALGFVALLVSALLLGLLKMVVQWRRRSAGRPPLRPGRLALGIVIFQLATIVALCICLPAWAASLLVRPDLAPILLTAGINILVGCTLAAVAAGALRDLMQLVQAVRSLLPIVRLRWR